MILKDVWCRAFPGFYNTVFDPDNDYLFVLDEDYNEQDYDYEQYRIDVCKHFVERMWHELYVIFLDNIELEFSKLSSPKYYNYHNDVLYINLTIHDVETFQREFNNWINWYKDYIQDRLIQDFTPQDGYIPFYEKDFDTFMKDVEFGNNAWCILLSYIAEYGPYLIGQTLALDAVNHDCPKIIDYVKHSS